jgi:hypothetical protein
MDDKLLRKTFGPKAHKVTRPYRKLQILSGMRRWVGHVAHMGEFRNACKILVGQLEG